MRGSIGLDEAFQLCLEDIELINDIIKSNYEASQKSGMPLI